MDIRKIGLLLIVCGGGLLLWLIGTQWREWRDWRDSDTWQTTPSTFLMLQPKTSQVRYTYAVDGAIYAGERTHFFVIAPFQDRRRLAWIAAHLDENRVTVSYDPDDPARSVLVRELEAGWVAQWLVLWGVVCLILLGPIFFFGSLWRWLRQQFAR